MKKIFTKLFTTALLLSIGFATKAQLLLNEDFTFSGLLTANGWTGHSGVGTNALSTTTGLTYAGLMGTGVGNAVLVDNSGGEDANKTFTGQSTNGQSVYTSMLVKITDPATAKTGDYIFHLGDGGGPTFTSFAARLFVSITSSNVNFGISNTSTATYSSTNFAKNTTYLVIIKYTINTGGNDPVSLWVIPSGVPATEAAAGTPELTNLGTAGQDNITAVALRQGSSVNSVQTVIDAIKIGTTWASVTPSSTVPPSLTTTGTLTNFGNVFIGSSSVSQSYMLSGANLTGFPGVITITAPANFEVSNNNTTWGSSTTIAYTGATLPSTPVWVRFTPLVAGIQSGNVTNTGGGVTTAVNVAVTGTGIVPATPVITAGALNAFGDVCLNTTAGPNSFTINGTNLTAANVTVAALSGFSFSTTATGVYTSSLSLVQPGGTFSQQVFVKFLPVASQSYNGNITVAGGGATATNVAASGAGANSAPTLTTGAASGITSVSATTAGTIADNGCSAVSAYGIVYSTTNNFPIGTGTMVASTNISAGNYTAILAGLLPATTYYYKAYATNGGGTGYGIQRSFVTATPVLTTTPLTSFGGICLNSTSAAGSFTISSTGLSAANISVGPLAGYSFSTSATGTFTSSLTITQPGGAFSQTIFVKFTPVAMQSYNGNIPVTGGGAGPVNVSASGTGVNSPATVTTGTASAITPNTATLSGTSTAAGCSPISTQGIEYSSIKNFGPGQGIKMAASSNTIGGFSLVVPGLVQNSRYYYRAYATNNGGTAYGALDSFKTGSIPEGLVVYNSPVPRGGSVHITLDNIVPAHYTLTVINMSGQMVFKRDMIIQVNFIDDSFILPYRLNAGLYMMIIQTTAGYKSTVPFMVK